jgi:hypothetical protein
MKGLFTEPVAITAIEQAYLSARGRWSGCDWPTHFGKTGLNLDGLKAAQALLLARATAGQEAADWRTAVTWLTQVEQEARAAEEEARQALALAQSGRLCEALAHARQAGTIAARYHRGTVWQPFREALETALNPV